MDHRRFHLGPRYRRKRGHIQRGSRRAVASPRQSRRRPACFTCARALPASASQNANFSIPEIQDIGNGLKTIKELGTFSEIDFTIVGLGTPREIHAGVVDGNYFDVMGLHPVLGRLLTPADDGPNAAGAAVLTYEFWSTSLHSDPTVIGKTIRLGGYRRHTFRGHRRGSGTVRALSGRNRTHRQRRHQPPSFIRHHGDGPRTSHDRSIRDGSLPAPTLDSARAELRTVLRGHGGRTS